MAGGVLVHRHLIFVLPDGRVIMDWGNQKGVDLAIGEFIVCSQLDASYPVSDHDLEMLKRMGRVASYDDHTVVVVSLPDPPHR
jgi:hypothetical protein